MGQQRRRWLQIATANTNVVFDIKGEAVDGRSTFLDNQSTTAMDPRVLDAMMPLMTWAYGNPHSRSHHYGWEAEDAVEEARANVGKMIGADAKEIIFTSGATECNNMAIKGVARFYSAKKKHIITTQTEHKCVLDSCRVLQGEGFDITYLPVNTLKRVVASPTSSQGAPRSCLGAPRSSEELSGSSEELLGAVWELPCSS